MDNGHVDRQEPSSYLRYLPALYQEDPFLGRFLHIFEDILSPIQAMVNTLPERFDPSLAPSPMLEFLASWVGAKRPARLPESHWRQLIRRTLWLHRWRGTKRGLRLALELATGKRPRITEYAAGLVLGQDAGLGLNTTLVEGRPLQINIAFDCPPEAVDIRLVDGIIAAHKPAHVSYTVIFQASAG